VNELQPLVFPGTGQQVRTVVIDGEPWWVAADVTGVLGYEHTPSAIRRLDDDEFSQFTPNVRPIRSGPPPRPMTIVNEPGLYSLILGSTKPDAKAFKRWVTHEVLPSIRRTGAYSLPDATEPAGRGQEVVNALARLAHREHVVPMAGRVLAYERWHKSDKGIAAFVQLTIDLDPAVLEGAAVTARTLPARGRDAAGATDA
jgi:prophage antirepressor-like protein